MNIASHVREKAVSAYAGFRYGHLPINFFSSVLNRMGGEEVARKYLRGELVLSPKDSNLATPLIIDRKKLDELLSAGGTDEISQVNFSKCYRPKWREKDGVIYLSVTSDGTTGAQWEMECAGWWAERARLGFSSRCQKSWTTDMLRSSAFKPTVGVTYNLAVLKMKSTDEDFNHCLSNLREMGREMGLRGCALEVAFLLHRTINGKDRDDMGGINHIVVIPDERCEHRPNSLISVPWSERYADTGTPPDFGVEFFSSQWALDRSQIGFVYEVPDAL